MAQRHPTTTTAQPTRRQRFRVWRRRWWNALAYATWGTRRPYRPRRIVYRFATRRVDRLDARGRRDHDWTRASGHDTDDTSSGELAIGIRGGFTHTYQLHRPTHAPADDHYHDPDDPTVVRLPADHIPGPASAHLLHHHDDPAAGV
jgi:hypothetical protein